MKLRIVFELADCIRRAMVSTNPFTQEQVDRLRGVCERNYPGFSRRKWEERLETSISARELRAEIEERRGNSRPI